MDPSQRGRLEWVRLLPRARRLLLGNVVSPSATRSECTRDALGVEQSKLLRGINLCRFGRGG